tara:strand:+ start:186 stop:1067 length:882 start_codon:yes stop_codon:yes gene_type:complete
MAYKLIYFLLLLSIAFTSWIQNPSPILTRPFDAKSVALGGINSFEKNDITSIQFSYSSSDETIFEESSILLHNKNRSYYISYFEVPDLDNTIDAWSDNGDGVPTSDEIDYTHITSFEYRSINFTYPIQLSVSNLEIWPTLSFSSLYEAFAYSAGFSISKRLSYRNAQLVFFFHDAISSKWWSTNRKEMYLPFLELIVNSTYNNMTILLDGIWSSSELNGRFGIDFHIHKNLSLRAGYESSGVFSFGTGIKINFIELDIAIVPSNIDHPFKPTQQFTLKLLTDKAWSVTKRVSP